MHRQRSTDIEHHEPFFAWTQCTGDRAPEQRLEHHPLVAESVIVPHRRRRQLHIGNIAAQLAFR
jgi:hypothetical protein